MDTLDFDLSNMTVEDLFRAKDERRKRLANLSFEEKIAIVKELQELSRTLAPIRSANTAGVARRNTENRIKTR
jgi:hypothetical protein